MKTEWTAGTHHLKFLQPDIVLCEVGGPALLEEMKELVRIMDEEIYPEVGTFFFFVRLKDSWSPIAPEVRKLFASAQTHWKAFVIIGGSAMLRAVVSISGRAVKQLRSSSFDFQVLETYEEACAYADRARRMRARTSNG